MVLLRLTVKVPLPEVVGMQAADIKVTAFMLPVHDPENVTLGQLAYQITEKWKKLRPDAPPLRIKKLLDDNYDTVELDLGLSVADVFVDTGKARADGLDQRGTIRVVQQPSQQPVRYQSVAQDWDGIANHYSHAASVRPPVPLFNQGLPTTPAPRALPETNHTNAKPSEPDRVRASIETENTIAQISRAQSNEADNNHRTIQASTADEPRHATRKRRHTVGPQKETTKCDESLSVENVPLAPNIAVEIKSSLASQHIASHTSRRNSDAAEAARSSKPTPSVSQRKKPRLSVADRLIIDSGRALSPPPKRQRRNIVGDLSAFYNYADSDNEKPIATRHNANDRKLNTPSLPRGEKTQNTTHKNAKVDSDVEMIDALPSNSAKKSATFRSNSASTNASKKADRISTKQANAKGSSEYNQSDVVDLTEVAADEQDLPSLGRRQSNSGTPAASNSGFPPGQGRKEPAASSAPRLTPQSTASAPVQNRNSTPRRGTSYVPNPDDDVLARSSRELKPSPKEPKKTPETKDKQDRKSTPKPNGVSSLAKKRGFISQFPDWVTDAWLDNHDTERALERKLEEARKQQRPLKEINQHVLILDLTKKLHSAEQRGMVLQAPKLRTELENARKELERILAENDVQKQKAETVDDDDPALYGRASPTLSSGYCRGENDSSRLATRSTGTKKDSPVAMKSGKSETKSPDKSRRSSVTTYRTPEKDDTNSKANFGKTPREIEPSVISSKESFTSVDDVSSKEVTPQNSSHTKPQPPNKDCTKQHASDTVTPSSRATPVQKSVSPSLVGDSTSDSDSDISSDVGNAKANSSLNKQDPNERDDIDQRMPFTNFSSSSSSDADDTESSSGSDIPAHCEAFHGEKSSAPETELAKRNGFQRKAAAKTKNAANIYSRQVASSPVAAANKKKTVPIPLSQPARSPSLISSPESNTISPSKSQKASRPSLKSLLDEHKPKQGGNVTAGPNAYNDAGSSAEKSPSPSKKSHKSFIQQGWTILGAATGRPFSRK
ncbi:hypothetical protein PRK78_006847 [Emydomyces testavorans]|uniref:Nucleolar protein Dnt1-like N-terminal domain-containing protein n=1 Tax=Emydomyces testavorans TaxID=2070801 RepID=A0AAF0DP69_9EURO|nr:hypothetical protein PRK78_006847 [Emydomyces testavorans]